MKNVFTKGLVFILLGFILSLGIGYLQYFQSIFILKPIEISDYFSLSPLAILLFIIFIDMLFFRLLRRINGKKYEYKAYKQVVYSSLYFFIIVALGFITILIIRNLYIVVDLKFQVEALLGIGMIDLFWFFIFLNIFISYLIISIYLMLKIDKIGLGFSKKLIVIVSVVIISSLIFIRFYNIHFLLPVVLSFLILIFVLDIFMEKKNFNSTWIFTWMILISGFTSLILFSGYSEQQSNKRKDILSGLIYNQNEYHEKIIQNDEINTDTLISGAYIEIDSVSEKEFLNLLNFGYYSLSESLFFKPQSGDYIKLLGQATNDIKVIKHLYNTEKKLEGLTVQDIIKLEYILFYRDRVLYNNTEYEKIPKPDNIELQDSVFEYSVNGLSYLGYKYNDELTVIQIEKIPNILMPFSLFSLLFVIIGVVFLLVSIFNYKFTFLPEIISVTFKGLDTFRDRIQVSVIGLLVISFFLLGVVTFYYFYNFSDRYQIESAKFYSSTLAGELGEIKSSDEDKLILDKLMDFERGNNVQLYYFHKDGKFIVDPRKKKNTIIAGFNPNINLKELILKENKIGREYIVKKRKSIMVVAPIFFKDISSGYLLSFYSSNDSILEASGVLSNFLNVYVLLFLLAGAIAIALANSISKPIDKLGEKLEILNLSEQNEILDWDNRDEIGKLISIYNKTVKKLEESARIITKIERDSAWREMAKQVAHEIKNPLTPLKLNIQYLQGVVKNSPERAGDMVKQIAPSLIEQINNLDKIATEFSDFAKMPSARNEKVKLNEIVKTVHDFFRKREDLDIQLYVPINDLIVFADKNHIVSILNNIIKNAIQAIPTDKEGHIIIELYKDKENSIIKISDNGIGISDDMKNKVFSPNFTTKSSGTGLGLAISTNMIQAFNGRIYFETVLNEGTSFYVEIPLMRLKDNFPEQERVVLD